MSILERPLELGILLIVVFLLTGMLGMLVVFVKAFRRFTEHTSLRDLIQLPRQINYSPMHYLSPTSILQSDIENYISNLEDEFSLRLSLEAKSLLIFPLIEYYRNRKTSFHDVQMWQTSINSVFVTLNEIFLDQERYQYSSTYEYPSISSMLVLQAFKIKWCSIPPFCRPA